MAKARSVLDGLLTSDLPATRTEKLPQGFTKQLPQERKRALMDAAMDLVDAGVDTPKKLALAMDQLAPDRKALPYTQAFWFALKASGANGKAEHKWAAIYREIDNAAEQSQLKGIIPNWY